MRLLDRYLFRELLAPLAYCLIGIQAFVMVFTVYGDAQKIQESKLHFGETIEYAAASSISSITIILPISLLLALLLTLTNYARHNEITAMRAAGMSLWRICVPYFAVGFFASLVLFALNEFCVPRGADWAENILQRYMPKPAGAAQDKNRLGFQNGRAGRIWLFSEFHFRAAELINVQVNWTMPDGSKRQLNADRAVRTNNVWTFFNVEEYAQVSSDQSFAPLLQTNILQMPQFVETPREMQIEIKISDYELARTHKDVVPLADILEYLRLRPGVQSGWVQTQLHQHLAAPWTCLVVVLIAIPFGAASGRRNLFFGVAGSIFICFLYFIIQQTSFAFGIGGYLPGWLAAWLPNLIFGATGIFLTARVR